MSNLIFSTFLFSYIFLKLTRMLTLNRLFLIAALLFWNGLAFGQFEIISGSTDENLPGSTEAVMDDEETLGNSCIPIEKGLGSFNAKIRVANLNEFNTGSIEESYPLPEIADPMYVRLRISLIDPPYTTIENFYPIDGKFEYEEYKNCTNGGQIPVYHYLINLDFDLGNICINEDENYQVKVFLALVTLDEDKGLFELYTESEFCDPSPDIYCTLFPPCYFNEDGASNPDGNIHTANYETNFCCQESDITLENINLSTEVLFNTSITPNPFKDQLKIELSLVKASRTTIQIFDIMGRVVYEETKNLEAGDIRKTVNTKRLQRGTYIIQIKFGEHINIHKLIRS